MLAHGAGNPLETADGERRLNLGGSVRSLGGAGQEGWPRHQRCREASSDGADGVVVHH